jgi:DNA-binding transcriptional ArsR family regulator
MTIDAELKNEDSLKAALFDAISHPTRIRILRILSETPLGFADLKHRLGISSSGNLAHHLEKLATLIEYDEDGNYALSDGGHEAFLAIQAARLTSVKEKATKQAGLMALLGGICFYAIMLTAEIFMSTANLLNLFEALLSSVISSIIFFVIFRAMFIVILRERKIP